VACSEDTAAIERGMQAQIARLEELARAGVARIGWKVALNDPAVQAHLGLSGIVAGALAPDREAPDGGVYLVRPGSRLMGEAEIGVRMARDLPGDATPEEAEAAIDALRPTIELADAARQKADVEALVSDSVLHEATVFGPDAPFERFAQVGDDHPQLLVNGEVAGRPAPALRIERVGPILCQIARRLADCGQILGAGEHVICGSIVKPVPVSPGDLVEVDFGALGRVSVRLQTS